MISVCPIIRASNNWWPYPTFDLATLVQTLLRLQTTTNSVIVVIRFMLFTLCRARSCKSSVIDYSIS